MEYDRTVLRPITMPRLPSAWTSLASELQELKSKLHLFRSDIEGYKKVERRLETITDQATWDEKIPLGPFAYFSGHLIHTNDISVTSPAISSPVDGSTDTQNPLTESDWRAGQGHQSLQSAKQARDGIKSKLAVLEQDCTELEVSIASKELKLKSTPVEGLDDGWGLNARGELMNEEGLPVFDIREEISDDVVEPARSSVVPVSADPNSKPRYLTQEKGRQTFGPTIPLSAPSPVAAASRSHTESMFAALEREEAEEARIEAERRADEPIEPTSGSFIARANPTPPVETKAATSLSSKSSTLPAQSAASSSSSSSSFVPPTSSSSSSPTVPKSSTSSDFLSSFSSGFLSRSKSSTATKFKPNVVRKPISPIVPVEPVLHEPRHHSLPASKSIYRATPPSTAPSTRPSSPRLDRRVAFDVLPPSEEKQPKAPKSVILLPAPPTPSSSSEATASSAVASTPASEAKKAVFTRPIKDNVVERPVKPPQPPSAKKGLSRFASERMTMGRPPKVVGTPIAASTAPPGSLHLPTTSASALPVHTISLSTASSTTNGVASVTDLGLDDEDGDYRSDAEPELDVARPIHIDSDTDTDSSGFYGNETEDDDDDEDDMDIDGALHAREIALEYHRLRSGVAAGAGTGPLGGDREPDAYDAWNQAIVPNDATMQGRGPGSGRPSRFRTGRLESTQMIIPALLASHVTIDNGEGSDGDDDDGMTHEESENVRRTLAMLAGTTLDDGGACTVTGQRIRSEEVRVDDERRPPEVRSTGAGPGVPIVVPSNTARAAQFAKELPVSIAARDTGASATTVTAPVKMSRFKARQLGLDLEE